MYEELYAAWQYEIENSQLGRLPSDFFERLTVYLSQIREEIKLAGSKNLKATLLEHEMSNATRMARDVVLTRRRKLIKMTLSELPVPTEILTPDEQKLLREVSPSAHEFGKFAANAFGKTPGKMNQVANPQPLEPKSTNKRVTLRFLKTVPPIIGVDMKSYGPFLIEDVASVPTENAKILIKQGLAKAIDIY